MSSAEHIYSIADNHAQTVQVCIDRLHELGANEQLKVLTGRLRKLAIRAQELRPTRAEAPVETMSTSRAASERQLANPGHSHHRFVRTCAGRRAREGDCHGVRGVRHQTDRIWSSGGNRSAGTGWP